MVAGRLGFLTCKSRPIPYNSATPEAQEFIKDNRDTIARWRKGGGRRPGRRRDHAAALAHVAQGAQAAGRK